MRPLDPAAPRRILVRGTNWVGDAVMTLPALATLARLCPQARIEVLARPWVAPIYRASPVRPGVRILEVPGRHSGARGRLRAAAELRREGFHWAVLFQNALEAAFIARWAGIPVRVGYSRDARWWLLTHAVPCGADKRRVHETAYYLHILHGAGLPLLPPPDQGVEPELELETRDQEWAHQFLARLGLEGPLLGLAPGAAFGPAKCWPASRFAAAARELAGRGGPFQAVLLFGSRGEAPACAQVAAELEGLQVVDLAGRTSLGRALALLQRLGAFVTNDSGLMHAAAALGTPTVAVFGSTNPATTAPLGERVKVVRHPPDCAPCKKPVCPRNLECFTAVSPGEVAQAVRDLSWGEEGVQP